MATYAHRSGRCNEKLPCGHPCGRFPCIKEDAHKTSDACIEACERKCKNGHPLGCIKFCFEPCGIKCQVKIKKTLPCGHIVNSRCSKKRLPNCRKCERDSESGNTNDEVAKNLEENEQDGDEAINNSQLGDCDEKIYKAHTECGHQYECGGGDGEPQCLEKCERKLKCGHTCKQPCWVECESVPCKVKLEHTFEGCGHVGEVCCSEEDPMCHQIVTGKKAQCGHLVTVPCYYTRADAKFLNRFCQERCSAELNCGHLCAGNCFKCHLGRFHARCEEKCGKRNICGHYCDIGCSTACPPCKKPCENYCEHGPCTKTCGYPCEPCKLPCLYQCPHSKCSMKCYQKCSRRPCKKPCPDVLPCGHACVGFCGEPCSPLCRFCDKEKLISESMDLIDLDEHSNLRFVFLENCGHTIEENVLFQWLRSQNSDGEIALKQCPLCRTTIWICRRFASTLWRAECGIRQVKVKLFGEKHEIKEKEAAITVTLNKLFKRRARRFGFFLDYLNILVRAENGNHQSKRALDAIHELLNIYSTAEEFMETYKSIVEKTDFEVSKTIIASVARCFDYIFTKLKSTILPLTHQEGDDTINELARIEHFRLLLERLYGERTLRQTTVKFGQAYLDRFEATVRHVGNVYASYSKQKQEIFREKLEGMDIMFGTTLGINERERKQIIQVFGTRTGRWFKCRNGHVYVVTECGGPTEKGICNECGVEIGGQHHSLLEDNQLAPEMDGAILPLYPNALAR